MASTKIRMAQKQLNKQEKLQKQKQRRVSVSRRSSSGKAKVASVPQASQDFSSRVMRRCFRARMFANAN